MMQLTHKSLGSTELMVSPLGLGTVKFGRNTSVKYPTTFKLPSLKHCRNILAIAEEYKLNLLDTAPAYGNSEEILGDLLQGQRQRWVLCSKVGEEFINNKSLFDFSAKHTESSIKRSLQRLQTDYLDLVLIHSNGDDLNIINNTDCIATLTKLKQQGHIRYFGMSTKTVTGGLHAVDLVDVVMVTYNPLEQEQKVVLDAALNKNKGTLIKKPLLSGHLSKFTPQKCIDFIRQHKGAGSIIIGTISPEHLQQNINYCICPM